MNQAQTDSQPALVADRAPDVAALLNPSNVCIVGARDGDGGWADRIHENLHRFGFTGPVYPVNPRRDQVWGEQAYKDMQSVPGQPDHALIVIPAHFAVDAVSDAIAAGARSATVLSGGFTQDQLDRLHREIAGTGFALSGPNCLGNISVPARLVTTTDSRLDELQDGPVAVIGQSGGIVMALNRALSGRGIGARYVVSTGNETCIDTADYLNHFATVDELRVVLAFVESVRDWPRFEQACRRLRASGKHLVALKVGQSESSRTAAASHTGALAGSYAAFEAVTARLGVVTVDTMESAVEACEYLSRCAPPTGSSVAAITISGGVKELILDAAERTDTEFAQFGPATRASLAAIIDEESVSNPMDTGFAGISSMATLVECVEAIAADPNVDVILLQEELLGRSDPRKEAGLRLLDESFPGGMARSGAKPVALFSISTVYVSDYGRRLRAEYPNLAFLQGVDKTLQTVRAVARAESNHRSYGQTEPAPTERTDTLARDFLATMPGAKALNEAEARELLGAYGFAPPAGGVATTVDQAVELGESLQFPVVLKVVDRTLQHKSDAGGVVTNLLDAEQLRAACERMEATFDNLEGYLVSTQIPNDKVEVVVGFASDPEVGPVVLVGSGGVETELSKDVAIVPVPCSPGEARAAIARTRLGTLLGAYRGREACDVEALVSAICSMSRLAEELGDLVQSAEVNPLALVPGRAGAWALDALVEFAPGVEDVATG